MMAIIHFSDLLLRDYQHNTSTWNDVANGLDDEIEPNWINTSTQLTSV